MISRRAGRSPAAQLPLDLPSSSGLLAADPISALRFPRRVRETDAGPASTRARLVRRAVVLVLPAIVLVYLLRSFGSSATERMLAHIGGLPVRDVRVTGADWVPPGEIAARAGKLTGRELFDVDAAVVAAAVASDSRIESVQVRRVLFHTIGIEVTERRPEALAPGGASIGVDREGVAFSIPAGKASAELPYVSGGSRTGPDRRVAAAVAGLAALKRSHPGWHARLSEVDVSAHPDVTAYLDRGGTPVRFRAGEWDRLGARLDAVFARLHAEQSAAAYVDLRFEDRAIVKPRASAPVVRPPPRVPGGVRPVGAADTVRRPSGRVRPERPRSVRRAEPRGAR